MKILIADEQKLFRDGVRPYLSQLGRDTVVFEAGSLDEAGHLADQAGGVDLALLGVAMPGMNGVNGLTRYRADDPKAKRVLLVAAVDPTITLSAIAAGADGVIAKTISGNCLLHALHLVLAGEVYLPADVVMAMARLATCLTREIEPLDGETSLPVKFAPSEMRVIPLLLDGLPNKTIAHHLGIDEAAVKARLRGVYRKIGVVNRAQAVWALMARGEHRSG